MSDVARDIDGIRNYLQGRLSEEEELLFQDRLARDPLLVRELEQSLRMREGLRQLKAEGYFAATPAPRTRNFRPGSLLQWLLPAVAAAVLVAVSVDVWWERTSVLSVLPPERAGATPPVAQFAFRSMRDDGRRDLNLPSSGLIEFEVAPETLIASSYRLTLIRHQGQMEQRIGSLGGLIPATDGYLHVFAQSSLLRPSRYSLLIEPEGKQPPSETKDYFFTLQTPSASPR